MMEIIRVLEGGYRGQAENLPRKPKKGETR